MIEPHSRLLIDNSKCSGLTYKFEITAQTTKHYTLFCLPGKAKSCNAQRALLHMYIADIYIYIHVYMHICSMKAQT